MLNQAALLEKLTSDILNAYPRPGIFSAALENLFIGRFNAPQFIRRQYRQPQFVVFMLCGSVRGTGEYLEEAAAGDSIAANLYVSSKFTVDEPPKDAPSVFVNVPLYKNYLTEILSRRAKPMAKESAHTVNSLHLAQATLCELEALDLLLHTLSHPLHDSVQQSFALEICLKQLYICLLSGPQGDFIRRMFSDFIYNEQLLEVIGYLGLHYQEDQSFEELAAKSCMSLSNFYRCFKEITSLTPQQYLKRLRLHEARRLLITEHRSVSETAYRVGYPSRGSFSIDYKKLFGHAPSQDFHNNSLNTDAFQYQKGRRQLIKN